MFQWNSYLIVTFLVSTSGFTSWSTSPGFQNCGGVAAIFLIIFVLYLNDLSSSKSTMYSLSSKLSKYSALSTCC